MSLVYDILINLVSDTLFVLALFLILWVLRRRQLTEARGFFGLDERTQINIFVSGFEHAQTATKRVVVAVEYEAAVELVEAFRNLSGKGVIPQIAKVVAGLIGQDPRFLEVDIGVSPLKEVKEPPSLSSLVLIGGPLRNQITSFYAQKGALFPFDPDRGRFLERVGDRYQVVDDLWNVAVLEKMIVEGQTVLIAFGAGERETKRAVQYLVRNWRTLHKQYPEQPFGIRLSLDDKGNVKVARALSG